MNKVLVLGCAGSGKSTFAKRLAQTSGLPVIHLDAHYWQPGWVEPPKDEWDDTVLQLACQPQWVMDGNYSRTIDIRLAEADTVFFFDFPRPLCLYRVLKRRIQNHGRTRADMAEGCPEKIDLEFIKWIWNFRKRSRPVIMAKLREAGDRKHIVVFRRPSEVAKYWANSNI